jgi:tetratricopeptide (TPR) repeat protein
MPRAETRAGPRPSRAYATRAQIETSPLRSLGVALLCAKVALVPVVFDPASDMPFVVSKALLSHALAYGLVTVLVYLLYLYRDAFFARSWIHAAAVAFAIANLTAALFAVNPQLALYGTHARMLGLGTTLDLIVLYFAFALLIRTRRDIIVVAASGLIASLVVLGYEAIQLLGEDPFSWSIDSVQRPFSTLGQATALAQYLTVLAIGTLSCAVLVATLRPWLRAFLVSYSLLLLAGALATITRSALLGVATGAATLLLLVWSTHAPHEVRRRMALGTVLGCLLLAGALVITPLGARVFTTVETSSHDDESVVSLEWSSASRLALYKIGVDMVSERPLLGWGPDNFIVGVPKFRPVEAPDLLRQSLASSPHSWLAHVATSSGLLGLTAFAAVVLLALATASRGGFRPTAIAAASMVAAFLGTGLTTVNEFGTEWLLWSSAGLVAGGTSRVDDHQRAKSVRKPDRRSVSGVQAARVGVVITVVTLVVALGSAANAFDGSRLNRASRDARLTGQTTFAIDLGRRAVASDNGRPEYWHGLGLAYVAGRRWTEAAQAIERALDLAPYDFRYVRDLIAIALARASDGDSISRLRALELAERGVTLDPNNPDASLTRAIVMQFSGNLPEAARSLERAIALDEHSVNASLWVVGTQVMLELGRFDDAIRIARQGIALLGPSKSSMAIRYELGRALFAAGRTEEALKELEAALFVDGSDRRVLDLRTEIRSRPPK